ncbi:MAG TPA: YXWGXW repeat-containing protein, partial [Methylovirgula sp.]
MPDFYSKKFLCSSSLMILVGVATLSAAPAYAQTVACEPPVVVSTAPPPLPVYSQPPVPGPNYLWTPGYWRWESDDEDYYWVPGTWVEPPRPGLLWTPGYWRWAGGSYLYNRGYWGSHVGYYGGISYGYGYTGQGYEGGRWERGKFFYNRTVNNISNTRITNVYEKTVVENRTADRASFNGGKGGIQARPTPEQKILARHQHFAPTTAQQQHVELAAKDKSLSNKANHGKPPIGATPRAADFNGA